MTFADTFVSALRWIDANRDAGAIVVEADVQGQACATFVERIRSFGLTLPIVVVIPQPEQSLAALNSGADGWVAGSQSEAHLPRVVASVIRRERARREAAGRKLIDIEAARRDAEQRLGEIQARHTTALARETRVCTALQQRLFELETRLGQADERRASDAAASADLLAKRHAEFTTRLAEAAQWRDTLASKLAAATAALEEAEQGRTAEAATAAERLARRETELGAALAEAVAAGTTLERALADAEAVHREARQRAEADLAAANERQAALEDLLAQESDARTILDQKLAAVGAARQEADQRHAAEMTTAAMRLAEVQARYDAALDESRAARAAFERRLTEAQSAHQDAQQRAAGDLAAAAERETELVQRLGAECGMREKSEHNLAATRMKAARARRRSLDVVSAHRRRSRGQITLLHAQLTGGREDAERQLRAKDEEIRQAHAERGTLQQVLDATREQLERLHAAVEEERQASERDRASRDSELQRVSAENDRLRQSLDQLQSAFQALEHIAGEHAAERARLEGALAERDGELSAQAARQRAAEQQAQHALAQVQERLDASGSAIASLQKQNEALRHDLEAARSDSSALRTVADRVPVLQKDLEASRSEWRRQFERAPYGLCRCSHDGVIADANHAFVALLGRRHADQLRNLDFAAAVSDSAGDLRWLIERARRTQRTETVETNWKTSDGRSLIVRLRALSTLDGAMEISVEDMTGRRALEDRLRQAQRMEAVGRLASEVAVNCDALLRDVTRDTHEWLAALGAENPLRRQGEQLLEEVTRAASVLRQVGVHGNEQMAANEAVSVSRTLRELAPVLTRVVGDDIELVLPKTSGTFDVGVGAHLVERMLVNVAGYARQRMADGGQMRIDLASVDVGRRFADRYPNVRPGPYVLMTVTEVRTATPAGTAHAARTTTAPSEKCGLDLRALAELVGRSGGHLWIDAQPAGNMVVKIHLPKRTAADASAASDLDRRTSRGGRLTKWFRRASTLASS